MSGKLFEFTSSVDAISGSPVSASSSSTFPADDDNGIKLTLDIGVSQLNAVAVAFGVHIICGACNTPWTIRTCKRNDPIVLKRFGHQQHCCHAVVASGGNEIALLFSNELLLLSCNGRILISCTNCMCICWSSLDRNVPLHKLQTNGWPIWSFDGDLALIFDNEGNGGGGGSHDAMFRSCNDETGGEDGDGDGGNGGNGDGTSNFCIIFPFEIGSTLNCSTELPLHIAAALFIVVIWMPLFASHCCCIAWWPLPIWLGTTSMWCCVRWTAKFSRLCWTSPHIEQTNGRFLMLIKFIRNRSKLIDWQHNGHDIAITHLTNTLYLHKNFKTKSIYSSIRIIHFRFSHSIVSISKPIENWVVLIVSTLYYWMKMQGCVIKWIGSMFCLCFLARWLWF